MNTKNFSSFLENLFRSAVGEDIELVSTCLDVTLIDLANNTGTQSIYTKWQGYEVMYHVATLLPYRPEDPQQLEKKRHIGNDLAIIIFQQGDDKFDLSSVASHQNHMIAFVRPRP